MGRKLKKNYSKAYAGVAPLGTHGYFQRKEHSTPHRTRTNRWCTSSYLTIKHHLLDYLLNNCSFDHQCKRQLMKSSSKKQHKTQLESSKVPTNHDGSSTQLPCGCTL